MSNNIPFLFRAAGGQPPPIASTQQQQDNNQGANPQGAFQAQGAAPQQAAFNQNAQLLGMDMSALAGISPEQLAAIARMFQSGALTLPPPPPSAPTQTKASAPSPSIPVAQQQPAGGQTTNGTNASHSQEQDVNMEMDDGELEEGEVGDTPTQGAGAFLRPPPTGPRNRSNSPRGPLGQRKPSPRSPVAQQVTQKQIMKSAQFQSRQAPQTNGTSNGQRALSRDEVSKMFILEMVKAGNSYERLAKEFTHSKPLRRMFKELGLSTPSDQSADHIVRPNAKTESHDPLVGPAAKALPTEEPRKVSTTTRPAPPPSKPAALDRSEYLARLQAAKNKKADSTAPTAPESEPANKAVAQPSDTTKTQTSTLDTAAPPSNKPSPAGKAVVNTQLIRQKLEALKAEQAARQNGTLPSSNGASKSSPAPRASAPVNGSGIRHAVSSPSQSGLGAGLAGLATTAAQASTQPPSFQPAPVQTSSATIASTQQVFSPTPPTPNRSFIGLPGLFMGGGASVQASPITASQHPFSAPQPSSQTVPASSATVQAPQSTVPLSSQILTTASPAPLAIPRKRPVAADFDDTPAYKPKPAKRPFGQSRGASEDESLIIHNSDSDSSDEDDNDGVDGKPAQQTGSFRNVPPLRDFPPRPGFQIQSSAPSTPGAGPGDAAAAEYEKKVRELEAMKRRIAQAESKNKMKTANTGKPSVPPVVASVAAETSNPVAVGLSGLGTPDAKSTPKPLSAVAKARLLEREKLVKRLAELESEREGEGAVEVVSVPMPAPAVVENEDEPEPVLAPVMSGALLLEKPADDAQMVSDPKEFRSSEEGELGDGDVDGDGDDSMTSDFYDQQDEGVLVPTAAASAAAAVVVVDDGKVGSQATTASASSAVDAVMEDAEVDGLEVENADEDGLKIDGTEMDGTEIEVADMAQDNSNVTPSSLPAATLAEQDENDEDAYDPAANVGLQDGGGLHVGEDGMVTPESSGEGSEEGEVEEQNDEEDEDESSEEQDLEVFGQPDIHEPNIYEPSAVRIGEHVEDEADESDEDISSEASHTDSEDWPDRAAESELMAMESDVVEKNDIAIDDMDLAPELQPSEAEQAESSYQKPARPKTHFTPYESPLSMFKDYRYHSEFLNTVPGGYKSLSYSNSIDPVKPLCLFEAAGGKCNDKKCANQHFTTMVLTDNDLLKDMGTQNVPAHTSDEVRRWNEGLGAVVKQLKTTDIGKDAVAIAGRIAQYRRDFVGDPTKVVNLG